MSPVSSDTGSTSVAVLGALPFGELHSAVLADGIALGVLDGFNVTIHLEHVGSAMSVSVGGDHTVLRLNVTRAPVKHQTGRRS